MQPCSRCYIVAPTHPSNVPSTLPTLQPSVHPTLEPTNLCWVVVDCREMMNAWSNQASDIAVRSNITTR